MDLKNIHGEIEGLACPWNSLRKFQLPLVSNIVKPLYSIFREGFRGLQSARIC